MGKVGSQTIIASLRGAGIRKPIIHIHDLSKEGIEKSELKKSCIKNGNLRYWRNIYMQKKIATMRSICKKWKIITLTRDPVARNISTYFHNIQSLWFPDLIKRYENGSLIIRDIEKKFFEVIEHKRPVEWFDCELKNLFDIDVFRDSFPKDKGFKIYKKDNIEVLVIKLEKLNECGIEALKKFLGEANYLLINKNRFQDKEYKSIYEEFNKRIRLPDEYLEGLYNTKYMKYFYTIDEINNFKRKWGAVKQ
jgi:hypothetical protein